MIVIALFSIFQAAGMASVLAIVMCVIFVVMQFVIVAASVVVIFLIINRKKLRTVPNLYIVSLCVSDFMVGAFFATSAVTTALDLVLPQVWCRFVITMELLSYTAGTISLLALAFDRYRATCGNTVTYKPTLSSATKIILAVWLFAVVYSMRNIVRLETEDTSAANTTGVISVVWCNTFLGNQTLDLHFRILDFFVVFLIPGIIMTILYTKIYRRMRSAFKVAPTTSLSRKRATVKLLVICVAVFFVCWLPIYLHDIAREIEQVTKHSTDAATAVGLEYAEIFFILFNSMVNPIIYAYHNKNFAKEIQEILQITKVKCIRRKKGKVKPTSDDLTLLPTIT